VATEPKARAFGLPAQAELQALLRSRVAAQRVAAVVERPAELLRLAEVEAAVVARAAEAPAAVRYPKCSELFRLDQ